MQSFSTGLRGRIPVATYTAAALSAVALALVILAIITSPWLQTVQANGASTIIMDRTQGPYRLVVGIIPARPVIPRTHLAIQVFNSDDESLLRDTDVDLYFAATGPPGASDIGPRLVLNEQTLRYFEIDVPFTVVGPWDVTLSVSSDMGDEVFSLNLDVEEPRAQVQWIWITAVLVAIFAVGIWTWLTLQRRRGER